jgi:pre-mRNA-splicing factor ISY1
MARPEEKAKSSLSRWIAQQRAENGQAPQKQKRPYLASLCDNLKDATKWRAQILREVAAQVTLIQNESLDEYKIRDMNDAINKLLREKHHWERRILELGGPSFPKLNIKDTDEESIVGPGGYVYFGAAKNLPGVRELLRSSARGGTHKDRKDLYRLIDTDYYGYRDDEDGALVPSESIAERQAIEAALEEWKEQQREQNLDPDVILQLIVSQGPSTSADQARAMEESFTSHLQLPSKEEMEAMLIERRKQALLASYMDEDA